MSKKEVYVIVSADNIAYELYINGPYYSYMAAQDALKNEFKESCVVNKDNKHKVIEKRIEGDMYRVLRENQALYYGWIKKIVVADTDTEAERWMQAVKDRMEAKNISIPNESEIAHIAEEAQHYAAKDEYFVGGFWNAIALAVQDYNEQNRNQEEGYNDDTNNAAESV